MNWIALAAMIGGATVGFVLCRIRAHADNRKHLERLNRWIDKQERRR